MQALVSQTFFLKQWVQIMEALVFFLREPALCFSRLLGNENGSQKKTDVNNPL
jgi:hypothetical protein